jgi:uncharacterized protein YndB with AHSA1/START domain
MTMTAPDPVETVQTLFIKKETLIAAPPEIVWETLFQPVGPLAKMNLQIEPFVGGRWYRDLGNNTGHLWGHVQVIKPPFLLEMVGPMMMSYPVASHVQYRLTESPGGTLLTLTHQAMGLIQPDHKTGVNDGWQMTVDAIRAAAEEKIKKS